MNPVLPPEPAEGQEITVTLTTGGVLYEKRVNGQLYRVTAPNTAAGQAHVTSNPQKCLHVR